MSKGERRILDVVRRVLYSTIITLIFMFSFHLVGIADAALVELAGVLFSICSLVTIWSEIGEWLEEEHDTNNSESFDLLWSKAQLALTQKDREKFLLSQKQLFLSGYSTVHTFCKDNESEKAAEVLNNVILCIADLDKAWSEKNSE